MNYLEKENAQLKARIKEYEDSVEHFAIFWEFADLIRKIPGLSIVLRCIVRGMRWIRNRKRNVGIVNNIKTDQPGLIGICNPVFSRGVRSATYAICDDVLEIPEIYKASQLEKAVEIIATHKPQKLLISGYATGYDKLIVAVKRRMPELRVLVYIHSAFIWFEIYPEENKVFYKMLELAQKGLIEKIGFCKRDVAEFFKEKGYNTAFIMNRFKLKSQAHKLSTDGKIRIGIWGANQWHRNLLNQVIAALMVPNAEIHVNELGKTKFLERENIVVHGFLPKDEYAKLLNQMDINMYVSFTDCFPMTLIESMEGGIPFVASDTSDVLSFDVKLRDSLIVSAIDGPIKISQKIIEILDDYKNVQKEVENYLPILHTEVEKSIESFLK